MIILTDLEFAGVIIIILFAMTIVSLLCDQYRVTQKRKKKFLLRLSDKELKEYIRLKDTWV